MFKPSFHFIGVREVGLHGEHVFFGFKKRPNTAGAQPMGGLPIEEFLAVMNGGGDSGDLVGKLMQLGISLASNAG